MPRWQGRQSGVKKDGDGIGMLAAEMGRDKRRDGKTRTLRERQRCMHFPPGIGQSYQAPIAIKKCGRGVVGPAAKFVGVLPVLARDSQVGSNCYWNIYISGGERAQ